MSFIDTPFAPIDVINQEESLEIRAPKFHRVDNARICYFCRNNQYQGNELFGCSKFGISFGSRVQLQVEFTCDDWEEIYYEA